MKPWQGVQPGGAIQKLHRLTAPCSEPKEITHTVRYSMLSKRLNKNQSSHSSSFSPGVSTCLPLCLSVWSYLQALDLSTYLRGLKITPLAKFAKTSQQQGKSASYRVVLRIWIPTTTSRLSRVVQFGAIRCNSTNSGCQSTQTCLIIRVQAKKHPRPRNFDTDDRWLA